MVKENKLGKVNNRALATGFLAVAHALRPELSDCRIAAFIGESAQNFHRARHEGCVSIDRIRSWVLWWNEAHPGHRIGFQVTNGTEFTIVPLASEAL